MQKTQTFPIGHPTIIREDQIQLDHISQYFGLIKCVILPPRNLYHPVLPIHIDHKNMFVLCYTCAKTCACPPCKHSETERALRGTWATPEIDVAIQLGYRLMKVYEVWHFEHSSNHLFSGYVELFLQEKFHSKGYPSHARTDQQRKAFIAYIFEKENVKLDDARMIPNLGRLLVAKLCLNCLWVIKLISYVNVKT